jgi:alkane 1-monooxygenase
MLAAHEMIHSRHRAERALGFAMLAGVNYGHFRVSHIYGHHRRACTAEDPATARRGESAYRFVLRSVAGQFAEASRHERGRAGHGWRALTTDRVHQSVAVAVAGGIAVFAAFGWSGLAFELLQSAIAVFLLELFNYIAHYGLQRRPLGNGRCERLSPAHSWSAAQRIDNWLLLKAGHHAHHHRAPSLPYPELAAVTSARRLPYGIAASMVLALIPPVWRRLMDPMLDEWRGSTAAFQSL